MLQFPDILYGPIHSRRLGVSLGINLLPSDAKICTFNCIYCECGFNTTLHEKPIPTREEVFEAMQTKFTAMQTADEKLDVITFAGNGEPTIHPDFEAIIDDTITLRDKFFPQTKIAVLTNSTQIYKPAVFRALNKIDNPILKLDSAFDSTVRLIDQPVSSTFTVQSLVEQMQNFKEKLIIQTIFLRGECNGKIVDNTTEKEVLAWLDILQKLQPQQVMIYTIDRETPIKTLKKVSFAELEQIAACVKALDIKVSVAG